MRSLVLFVAAAAVSAPVSAQSLPDWAAPSAPASRSSAPPPAPGGGGGAPPQQVPIDGGLALLAIAGAGYAARKLRQS